MNESDEVRIARIDAAARTVAALVPAMSRMRYETASDTLEAALLLLHHEFSGQTLDEPVGAKAGAMSDDFGGFGKGLG